MTSLFDNVDIVKSGKNFRIPSETTLQHSIFDRIRQIYLLKDVNWCIYTLSSSVDVRRRVSQSKKISNDQVLIQLDPISCPQNQKGNN